MVGHDLKYQHLHIKLTKLNEKSDWHEPTYTYKLTKVSNTRNVSPPTLVGQQLGCNVTLNEVQTNLQDAHLKITWPGIEPRMSCFRFVLFCQSSNAFLIRATTPPMFNWIDSKFL